MADNLLITRMLRQAVDISFQWAGARWKVFTQEQTFCLSPEKESGKNIKYVDQQDGNKNILTYVIETSDA